MVNKVLLSLAAVVLFVVFGTGVFVGMQVGGLSDGGPADSGATDGGTQTTDTPGGGGTAATDTPASESGSSADSGDGTAERESIPPREFNERNISTTVVTNINDAREAEGLDRLSTSGATATDVQMMAASHSEAMANAGLLRHTIDGVSSPDRYRQSDLYNTCQFQVESFIQDAEDNDLEVIGRTYAGQEYPDNGAVKFHENDTAVASALTEDWLGTQEFRDRLFYENAGRLGVGVTVTNTGVVYATANVC